jgi:uncharacterized protein YeaO (DUF488 family)
VAEAGVVRVGRVYDAPGDTDGARVLVDRLWPRGLSKQAAALTQWCREVAPSAELRRWYGHDPARCTEFQAAYRAELADGEQAAALASLREMRQRQAGAGQRLTLLTATKDPAISHAAVLAEMLSG